MACDLFFFGGGVVALFLSSFFFFFFKLGIFLIYISNAIPKVPHTDPLPVIS
jgi:hypothetical protein